MRAEPTKCITNVADACLAGVLCLKKGPGRVELFALAAG